MPSWNPNWSNVHWDWGAADAAARALRNAADQLDSLTDARLREARSAQAQWRGRFRVRFDDDLTRWVRKARNVAAQFRHKADQIHGASQRAREEQHQRESERRRWWDEKRREEEEEQRRRQTLHP